MEWFHQSGWPQQQWCCEGPVTWKDYKMQLHQASRQWATRDEDERFVSLYDMADHFHEQRDHSKALVVSSRRLHAEPMSDNQGLLITGPNGHGFAPTHHSFGQLAQLAQAPAGYLRTLPSPVAADCLNYGLQFKRDIEDVGVLLQKNGESILRAATGPRYGRIWNSDIVDALTEKFGDGVNGDWRVPGEFGKRVTVTKANTTLYAGDRDMFIFLADEDHRIEMKDRRNGQSGSLARGFFLWNSEVGASTFGLSTFLFDYTCCNRIVWGAQDYKEIRIRHTVSAPDKFLEEMKPALIAYANSSAQNVTEAIKHAQEARLENKLDDFLANRFGARTANTMKQIHQLEEGRPIETAWDVVTAATAYARGIEFQNERVEIERQAGQILDMAF